MLIICRVSIIFLTLFICGPSFVAKFLVLYPHQSQHPIGFIGETTDGTTCGNNMIILFSSATSKNSALRTTTSPT